MVLLIFPVLGYLAYTTASKTNPKTSAWFNKLTYRTVYNCTAPKNERTVTN